MTKKYFFYDKTSNTGNDKSIKQLLLALNDILKTNQSQQLLAAVMAKKNTTIGSLTLMFSDTSFATKGYLLIDFNNSTVSLLILIVKSFELLLQELNNKSITHIDSLFYDGLYFYLDLPDKQTIIEKNRYAKFVSNASEKAIRNSKEQNIGDHSSYIGHTNYLQLNLLHEVTTWREYPLSVGYKALRQEGSVLALAWDEDTAIEFHGDGNLDTDVAQVYEYLNPGMNNTKINMEKYPAKKIWKLWEQLDKEVYQPQQDLFWQLSWDGNEFGLYINRDRSFYDKLLKD